MRYAATSFAEQVDYTREAKRSGISQKNVKIDHLDMEDTAGKVSNMYTK
jgi:hypothetical protein